MDVTRRTFTRTVAWSAPVVTVAATVPAYAASVTERVDPGLNGWLNIAYGTEFGFDARFRNDLSSATPDGNPFGLYLPHPNLSNPTAQRPTPFVTDKVTNASQTLWFRGQVSSWSTQSGHSSRWSRTAVGTQTKGVPGDRQTYYGYRFDYNGAYTGTGIYGNGFDYRDGRLWLEEFDIQANDVQSNDATFWVSRQVTIDIGQGAGPEVKGFERRNGERGALGDGFPLGFSRKTAGAGVWSDVI